MLPTTVLGVAFTSLRNRFPVMTLLLCTMMATLPPPLRAQTDTSPTGAILKPADMSSLMPATVFFRGQVASVQARNSGGVKLADGMFVLSALVDTSGYSTGLQQKYQGYLINESTIDVNGHPLKPGAYGVGFIEGNQFLVMDLGAHDLFTVASTHDDGLKRPMPLQVLADPTPTHYRLYFGRNYVVFSLAAAH